MSDGDTPFQCIYCTAKFATLEELERHGRKMHDIHEQACRCEGCR